MKVKYCIIGAGVGGLGAGVWLKQKEQDFIIIEGNSELPINLNNGVHYLHSLPVLPLELQKDIKKITLTEGVMYSDGTIKDKGDLNDALNYAMKVREIYHPSSIMNVGKRDFAYLPSSNLLNSLLKGMEKYIGSDKFLFNHWVQSINFRKKIVHVKCNEGLKHIEYEYLITTLPLNLLLKLCFIEKWDNSLFQSKPIEITNFNVSNVVPNWGINLYLPEIDVLPYRASILNGLISIESIKKIELDNYPMIVALFNAFDIDLLSAQSFQWKTGKIISISEDLRKEILKLLESLNIYTIGRFGQWDRKLLIDDTIKQAVMVIEKTKYE